MKIDWLLVLVAEWGSKRSFFSWGLSYLLPPLLLALLRCAVLVAEVEGESLARILPLLLHLRHGLRAAEAKMSMCEGIVH